MCDVETGLYTKFPIEVIFLFDGLAFDGGIYCAFFTDGPHPIFFIIILYEF